MQFCIGLIVCFCQCNSQIDLPVGEEGGGTLIFPYIHRLGPFLGVQNFEFQYFWLFSENEYLLGVMTYLWIIFWDRHKIGLYLGVISMHLRVFS